MTDVLLLAAGRGDIDAFAAFYDVTAPLVVGLLHTVLTAPEPAERGIAEVYLAIWRNAPAFDPGVRSADATLLLAVRRVLIGPVRTRLTSPGGPSGDAWRQDDS